MVKSRSFLSGKEINNQQVFARVFFSLFSPLRYDPYVGNKKFEEARRRNDDRDRDELGSLSW